MLVTVIKMFPVGFQRFNRRNEVVSTVLDAFGPATCKTLNSTSLLYDSADEEAIPIGIFE